jgi:hypothetical protein
MSDPLPDAGVDAMILDRMTNTLVILQAKHASKDRAEVIAALRALCESRSDATVVIVEGETEAVAIEKYLAGLERTSLGSSRAREVRAGATAQRVARILIRHEQTADANSGVPASSAAKTIAKLLTDPAVDQLLTMNPAEADPEYEDGECDRAP